MGFAKSALIDEKRLVSYKTLDFTLTKTVIVAAMM